MTIPDALDVATTGGESTLHSALSQATSLLPSGSSPRGIYLHIYIYVYT
jgi:hypothetical protein